VSAVSAVDRIVRKCLAKRRLDRFQSMHEVRVALDAWTASDAQPSIAVLPFENMSGDKENEYFSDGLAEEIINALTRVPGLKLIASTSAFAFKGKYQDVRRIADALGVSKVLEGSVRKAGSRIRVAASSSRPQKARTSGRSATTASSPTSLPCRTRSHRRSRQRCR